MTHLTSVVIPTYNRGRLLCRAINSVLAQMQSRWEIIVIDNSSTDDTHHLIEQYNDTRIKLETINNNGIIAASRNRGIEKSSGDYIAFLDSDDWWLPDKLTRSETALQGTADIVYHDFYIYNEHTQRREYRKATTRRLRSPAFDDLITNGNALITSGVVVRRKILERSGGFPESPSLVNAEDYACWLNIAKLTDNFHRIDRCLGSYSIGPDNASNTRATLKNTRAILREYRPSKPSAHSLPIWALVTFAIAHYKRHQFQRSAVYALHGLHTKGIARLRLISLAIFILSTLHRFARSYKRR